MTLQRPSKHSALTRSLVQSSTVTNFVIIHPFLDGNDRMCRLILNAILLRYAGVVVCLGKNDEVARSTSIFSEGLGGGHMEGSGELASLVLKKAMGGYRLLKQKLTGKKR